MALALAVALIVVAIGLVVSLVALRRSQQRAQQTERRATVAELLLHNSELERALELLLQTVAGWWSADTAFAVLLSDTDRERCFVAGYAPDSFTPLTGDEFSEADSGMAEAFGNRGAIPLGRATDDRRVSRFSAAHGLRRGAVAPLRTDGELTGMIAVGNGRPIDQTGLAALDDVARQLGHVLHAGHLESAVAELAATTPTGAENLDPTTNLPNRTMLADELQRALGARSRSGRGLALIAVEAPAATGLDHAERDARLTAIAARLGSVLRHGDTAARIGEDSFALLLTQLLDDDEAHGIADRLLAGLGRLDEGATASPVSLSIRTIAATDTASPATLLRELETALMAARRDGGGIRQLTDAETSTEADDDLLADLRAALTSDGLTLNYQPIVNLGSGAVLGAEALVRWNHPSRGMVPPLEFLQLAEESGLAADLGVWVLRTACAQLVEWQRDYPRTPPLAVSINVSAAHLVQPGFSHQMLLTIGESGIDPECVILEFAEDVLLHDLAAATEILDPLQRAGVHLAVDDVGTGYSTLEYLRRLPVDILKIGRPFIEALVDEDPATGTAHLVVEQGERLRMVLVAEGVENQIQVTRLRDLGCVMAQGYHLARPTDVAGLNVLLSGDGVALDMAAAAGATP